jgi:hypothetical protein
LGSVYVPEASITARARICLSPDGVATLIAKGASSRPTVFILSKPRRVTSVTRCSVRRLRAMSGTDARGARYDSTSSRPVGYSSPSGALQPARSSSSRAGRVDVVLPRRKDPDVAPAEEARADRRAGLEDQRCDSALDQLRRGRKAHGTCADDRHRKLSVQHRRALLVADSEHATRY